MAVLSLALAAAIFAFDLSLPLGVAGGVPYVALVLLGFWWPWRRAAFALAGLGTVLTLLGYVLSPEGGIPWMGASNRVLALFVIWIAALMVYGRKRAEEALRKAHDELEVRVGERTAELTEVNAQLMQEITERKVAEREAAEKSALLGGLISHSPVIISIKDTEGRYILVNPKYETHFGVSNNEARGKTVYDVLPKQQADLLTAQDRKVIATGRPAVKEHDTLHTDGSVHSYLTVKFPVLDPAGTVIASGTISIDITERVRAEEALRESEARLRRAQEIARVGDFVWDEIEDRVVARSPVVSEIYGVTGDAAPATLDDLLEIIHPDDRDRVRGVFGGATGAGKPYDIEYRIVRAGGEIRYVQELSAPIFDANGEHVRSLGTMQDVTERKQLERQLVQSSKLATLGEMAAGLAHELNQPLHIIRMAADGAMLLMQEGEADVDYHGEQFDLISGQTQRMSAIIDHMCVFARLDDDAAVVFDPANCVRNAIALVADQFRADDLPVSTTIPATCRPLLGRPVRLEQVVLNLLSNARDAIMAQPRVKSRRRKERISVVVVDDHDADVVRISVSDSGGGIPAEVIERIFYPFFTTKEVGKGTGLGLSISHGIVAEMGGVIEAANVGEGARFTITLPTGRLRRAPDPP